MLDAAFIVGVGANCTCPCNCNLLFLFSTELAGCRLISCYDATWANAFVDTFNKLRMEQYIKSNFFHLYFQDVSYGIDNNDNSTVAITNVFDNMQDADNVAIPNLS